MFDALRTLIRDPVLRLIITILFLYGTIFSAIGPYQALIGIEYFNLPDWAWSLVMFVAALVTVSASIGVGIISDQRDNRRAIAAVCAALSALGGSLVWIFDAAWAFLLVHLLIWPIAGSIFGQLFALARLAVRAYGADAQDTLMAAVRAIFALAFVVSLPIWSFAFSRGAELVVIYPVNALLALGICALILTVWDEKIDKSLRADVSGLSFLAAFREVLTAHILVRVALLAGISAANVLFMSTLGLLFEAADGRTFSDAALFLTIVTAFEVPFMLYMGLITTRYGKVRLISLGGVFYGIFYLVFVGSISQVWVWAMAIPAALGAALILSVPITYLQDLLAHRPGAGGSLLAVNQVAGFGVASAIFGAGTTIGSYETVAAIGAFLAILSGIGLAIVELRSGNWRN